MLQEKGELPIFLSTTELFFRCNVTEPVKMVTVYNPYLYPISYKVMSNATRYYTVNESSGTLQPHSCKDISVRSIQSAPAGTIDKLKIEVRKKGDSNVIGSGLVCLTTVPKDYLHMLKNSSVFDKEESSVPAAVSAPPERVPRNTQRETTYIGIFVAVILAVVLLSPISGDPEAEYSSFPKAIHVTLPQKLAAAYSLGILTVFLIKHH